MAISNIGGSCTVTTAPISFLANETYVSPYTIPSNGTVTSVCFRARGQGTVVLIVLKANGINWDYVGESPSVQVTQSSGETLSTSCNIVAQAGDRIGWYCSDGCYIDCLNTTGTYNYYSTIGKQTGTNFSLPNNQYNGFGDAGIVVTFDDVITHLECVSGTCTQVTGAGTNTCNTIGSTTECTIEYTHVLEIRVRPWGWYTPQSAATNLITKLNDINGWCLNLISGLTDWQYVGTDIITRGADVIVQSKFKQLSPAKVQTMGIQAILFNIAAGIGLLLLISQFIGIIFGWDWLPIGTPPAQSPKYVPPPKEILPGVQQSNNKAGTNCLTGLPINPTCTDLNNYAICLDSVHIGIYGTLQSVYPNFIEFQNTYKAYLNKYVTLVSQCNPSTPGSTPDDIANQINKALQDYNDQIQNDFNKLQQIYEQEQCCIGLPFLGCVINKGICNNAMIVAYAVIGGAGLYIAYNIYTSLSPNAK